MELISVHAYVKFEFEALHSNPKALPGEWYEKGTHRHIFTVEAKKSCGGLHSNISSHLLRREMLAWAVEEFFKDDSQGSGACDAECWKCESLAFMFAKYFVLDWCKVTDSVGSGAEVSIRHDD